jgi:hypothetical protein
MSSPGPLSSPGPEGPEKPGRSGKSGKKDMAKHKASAPSTEAQAAPSSRVTIALPFLPIRMPEPSQELADVVALIGDLVTALQGTLGATQFDELGAQADPLRARLR